MSYLTSVVVAMTWTLITLSVAKGAFTRRAQVYTAGQKYRTHGEYLVVLRPEAERNAAARTSVALEKGIQDLLSRFEEKHGITPLRRFRIGQWKALLITANMSKITDMLEDRDIDFIESNQVVRATDGLGVHYSGRMDQQSAVDTPHEDTCCEQSSGSSMWGLTRISARGTPKYKSGSYQYTPGDDGAGTDIYVVDSGINTDHEEFGGRARWGYLASGLAGEGNGDLNGHGTNVASIAVGKTTGVAKASRVISVKALGKDGSGQISWAIEGLEWIVNDVMAKNSGGGYPRAVINLSLGSETVVYSMDQAVQAAVAAGISVVVAAGNEFRDACEVSPARVSSAVTVAATNDGDYMTSFSNYGPCVDILAPGEDILGASGGGTASLASVSGTSQAAPFVTGVLARYLSSVDPALYDVPSPAFLKAVLTDTATEGRVKYRDVIESSTPNLLLYRGCDFLNDTHVFPPMPDYIDSGAGATPPWGLYLTVGLIMLPHMAHSNYM